MLTESRRIESNIKSHIKEVFGTKVFRTIISRSVRLEESPAYKESIFTHAANSIGALQYRQVAEEIVKRAKK